MFFFKVFKIRFFQGQKDRRLKFSGVYLGFFLNIPLILTIFYLWAILIISRAKYKVIHQISAVTVVKMVIVKTTPDISSAKWSSCSNKLGKVIFYPTKLYKEVNHSTIPRPCWFCFLIYILVVHRRTSKHVHTSVYNAGSPLTWKNLLFYHKPGKFFFWLSKNTFFIIQFEWKASIFNLALLEYTHFSLESFKS